MIGFRKSISKVTHTIMRDMHMDKIYKWYTCLSKRIRDSLMVSVTIAGLISTICTIFGISLSDWTNSTILKRIAVAFAVFAVIFVSIYLIIGKVFENSIGLIVRKTPVTICCGDIFKLHGWKVIGCDTHFDTRVDDIVISKKSLHGQLILNHGKKEGIEAAVDAEAKRLGLQKNSNGLYDFPLGTIIRYDSSVDNQTYLMLAMTELNENYEAHTNMAKFELMLMRMWAEIDRVYASNKVVIPVLGTGISRFDDGPKDKDALLRCMLCTLNSSGISLNSEINVVIYGNAKDVSLYEYKDMFHMILKR